MQLRKKGENIMNSNKNREFYRSLVIDIEIGRLFKKYLEIILKNCYSRFDEIFHRNRYINIHIFCTQYTLIIIPTQAIIQNEKKTVVQMTTENKIQRVHNFGKRRLGKGMQLLILSTKILLGFCMSVLSCCNINNVCTYMVSVRFTKKGMHFRLLPCNHCPNTDIRCSSAPKEFITALMVHASSTFQ